MLCECVCMFIAHSHRNYGIDLAGHYRSYHVIISTFDPEKKTMQVPTELLKIRNSRGPWSIATNCQFYKKRLTFTRQ